MADRACPHEGRMSREQPESGREARRVLDADARYFLHQAASTPGLSAVRRAEGIWAVGRPHLLAPPVHERRRRALARRLAELAPEPLGKVLLAPAGNASMESRSGSRAWRPAASRRSRSGTRTTARGLRPPASAASASGRGSRSEDTGPRAGPRGDAAGVRAAPEPDGLRGKRPRAVLAAGDHGAGARAGSR